MELDRQILKFVLAYFKIRELFHIAGYHFDFIIGLLGQLLFYQQTSL